MQVVPIKTDKITASSQTLEQILVKYLPKVKERSVLAVTSKIVSLCEGRVVKMDESIKDDLIKKESQYYLPRELNPYKVSLTVTRNNLVATAGIDESNGNGNFVLWPEDPQSSANTIRDYLLKKFNLKEVGVIITDSRTIPMRWGVTAFAMAYSGFKAMKDYVGQPDIFGRPFRFEMISVIDSLATSAALVMGEGNEQTPLAIISEIPFVEFQDRHPSVAELEAIKISLESDLYGPLLKNAPWQKGNQN